MSHFDDNNILIQYQHGFRSQHSCESQLISFMQVVYDNLENCNQTGIIVMDFTKAFDKVDHNKRIYKLSALRIHLLTTRWIKSFLQCRTPQVRIDGCTSDDALAVVYGVPKGQYWVHAFS